MSIDDISRYWKVYVKPDFDEYEKSEHVLTYLNEEDSNNHENTAYLNALRHAKHVLVSLNQMSDYVCNHLDPQDQRIGGTYGNATEFRKYITKNHNICGNIRENLSLINDLADTHKHSELRVKSRQHNVQARTTGWGQLPWGEFKWGGAPQIVAHLTNGHQRGVLTLVRSVVEWWEEYIPEIK